MICYIDTSVLLRSVLNHPKQFKDWKQIETAFSSELLSVESHRVIDRYRLEGKLSDSDVSEVKSALSVFLRGLTLFEISRDVVKRASETFPTVIGTLDAIHLSTALLWRDKYRKSFAVLSFDDQLRTAAKAMGLEILPE